ncbi:MarR family winged helix-turn-helix transcriptional regulator [Clostridioides difficile]|nr:MarR family winged helix-turn-helix transcriptional regulator [Clostridioides difficile]
MKTNYDCFRIAMLLKELYSKTMYTVEESFKENGLTHQQIIVIKLIAHNQELTISQLCDEMSLAKGTVSGIISRLEQIGYVEKFKKYDDKRNTYVKFTENGLEFAINFKSKMQESFDGIFKNCDEKELDELVKNLRNILAKIKEK